MWKTRYANIGVLICWDQWYPEAARITALLGADILFYPTAIGWHPGREGGVGRGAGRRVAHDPARARHRQRRLRRRRNRVGFEPEPGTDGLEFFGHSFICDPFGR